MKKKIKYLLLFFALSLISIASFADDISGRVEKTKYMIGDRIEYSFQVPINKEKLNSITTFSFSDTLQMINQKIDTIKSGDKSFLKFSYSFVSFVAGTYNLPTYLVYENSSTTPLYNIIAPTIEIAMPKIDTVKIAVKPIKSIMKVPITFKEILPFAIGVIVLAAIIFGIIYYFKHREKKPKIILPIKKEKVLPEDVIALRELEKLKSEHLIEKNETKQHYIYLTDILWYYIGRRFNVNAIEKTSSQIIEDLGQTDLKEEERKRLNDIFTLADLVKFAKYNPDNVTNLNAMQESATFINNTKRNIIEKEENKDE
jgi:large-conductance mechanosensitive channel